jgi:glycosyltransferase involved in cell wall biosynthesis
LFVTWSARRCREVLTLSRLSKADIVRFLGIDERKVEVASAALAAGGQSGFAPGSQEANGLLAGYGIRRPYVLTVGLGAHKNAEALVRALPELKQRTSRPDLTLVVTGRDYGAESSVRALAERLGVAESVTLTGFLDAQDLPTLFASAEVYATLSLFEGFGMTALEAMSWGIPTVVSNRASLPEVVADAGLIVDPDDGAGVVEALLRALDDPGTRARLSEAGRRRAANFTWEETARRTLEAYRRAAGAAR